VGDLLYQPAGLQQARQGEGAFGFGAVHGASVPPGCGNDSLFMLSQQENLVTAKTPRRQGKTL
jgi:hypothetical protein